MIYKSKVNQSSIWHSAINMLALVLITQNHSGYARAKLDLSSTCHSTRNNKPAMKTPAFACNKMTPKPAHKTNNAPQTMPPVFNWKDSPSTFNTKDKPNSDPAKKVNIAKLKKRNSQSAEYCSNSIQFKSVKIANTAIVE